MLFPETQSKSSDTIQKSHLYDKAQPSVFYKSYPWGIFGKIRLWNLSWVFKKKSWSFQIQFDLMQ